MTRSLRSLGLAALCALWAAPAGAQSPSATTTTSVQSAPATQTSSSDAPEETRPATTTFFGDTGLWFVPTGEVLDHGKWSVSGYRRGTNYIQGFSNVGDIAGTFAVGIKNRAELFGSFLVDTRIDRDLRAAVHQQRGRGRHCRSRPAGAPAVDRRQRRRLLPGREDQPVVGVPPESGGAGLPRHGEAADRRQGRGRLDRAGRFQRSTSSAARNCGARSSCRGMPATNSGASRTASTFRAGATRWGVGAGFPSRSAVTRRARTGRLGAHQRHGDDQLRPGGGRGRQYLAGDLGDPEPDAGERRADLAASDRGSSSAGAWPGISR